MNPEYEQQLETEIDRELKRLPELPAPATLSLRVMQAIAARAAAPWYRQSWGTWPAPWRTLSFVVLAALFGGLCYAAWAVPHSAAFAHATQKVASWFSGFSVLRDTLNALATTTALVFKRMGTGFLVGGLAAIALAWVMCLSLGTAFVRLALARR